MVPSCSEAIFCISFLIAFVLNFIFGNGIESWRNWIGGIAFFIAIIDLVSIYDDLFHYQEVYLTPRAIGMHVLSLIVVAIYIYFLVSEKNILCRDWIFGFGCAFSVRSLTDITIYD